MDSKYKYIETKQYRNRDSTYRISIFFAAIYRYTRHTGIELVDHSDIVMPIFWSPPSETACVQCSAQLGLISHNFGPQRVCSPRYDSPLHTPLHQLQGCGSRAASVPQIGLVVPSNVAQDGVGCVCRRDSRRQPQRRRLERHKTAAMMVGGTWSGPC